MLLVMYYQQLNAGARVLIYRLRCRLVDDASSADCWVINTCTVKSPSQSAMDNLLEKGRAGDKALVVAGCVPQGDRRARQLQGLSVLGECRCRRHSICPLMCL